MRKIMFNDKYGLTQAVLEGRKTMTRRIVQQDILDNVELYRNQYYEATLDAISFEDAILNMVTGERMFQRNVYRVGEEVSVSQSYENVYLGFSDPKERNEYGMRVSNNHHTGDLYSIGGWTNKMFVSANLMPHKIKITDIKVKHLQDISDTDCISEGVIMDKFRDFPQEMFFPYSGCKDYEVMWTPQAAFRILIDKVSGKGTWEKNPLVFVYVFKLIDNI